MDIIIHGKPLAGSMHSTDGIDPSLCQRIVNEFFEGMAQIKDQESLVVDARMWKGTWSSVYTFLLGKSIKDTANRESYFALSIVIPRKYCCLISQVYSLLQKVIRESVMGVYLAQNGQFLVQNLDNSTSFNRLCENLRKQYVNLEEEYDSTFQAATELRNDIYCNLIDCDSKAFVNLLKTRGRIIVTDSAATKDALATQARTLALQVQQLQSDLQTKAKTIDNQTKQISQLQESARQANSSASNQVNRLKTDLSALQAANKKLSDSKQELQDSYDELKLKVKQIAESLHSSGGNVSGIHHKTSGDKVSIRRFWSLSAFNTILLVLLTLLVLLSSLKGCLSRAETSENEVAGLLEQNDASELQNQLNVLEDKLDAKDQEIAALQEENVRLNKLIDDYKGIQQQASSLMRNASTVKASTPQSTKGTVKKKTETAPQKEVTPTGGDKQTIEQPQEIKNN